MKVEDSPFIYGTTVSIHSFTNREYDAHRLKQNMLNGINTTLISPRRWGKSSLVERVAHDLRTNVPEVRVALLDLFTVSSQEEFLEAFAREVIRASTSKWEDWLTTAREMVGHIVPRISLGVDPNTDFSLKFDWHELQKHADDVLNLPQQLAKRKGIRIIICLDEFQNLAYLNGYEAFEKKLRAVWQRQSEVTYCLYGSKRHMMSTVFNSPSKPFYRFGDIMLLQKISRENWVSFMCEGFANTGKKLSPELAEQMAATMENHSWYVQQLAHYTWKNVGDTATVQHVNAALDELIHANTPLYQHEVEGLSNTQVNFLRAVAKGETRFTSKRVMDDYHLGTPNNVRKNKAILRNADIVNLDEGRLEFLDPAFALWFKLTFFNTPYKLKSAQ